jgi:hypothetical protein
VGALCPLYPKMSKKGMHLRSLTVSEKLCIIKELLCTWIKNAWVCTLTTLVDKMYVNTGNTLNLSYCLTAGRGHGNKARNSAGN